MGRLAVIALASLASLALVGCNAPRHKAHIQPVNMGAIVGSATASAESARRSAEAIVAAERKAAAIRDDARLKELAQTEIKVREMMAHAESLALDLEAARMASQQAAADADAARAAATEQARLIKLQAEQLQKSLDRLTYLEEKYAGAVGLLWKWRGLTIGAGLVGVVAGVALAIFGPGLLRIARGGI